MKKSNFLIRSFAAVLVAGAILTIVSCKEDEKKLPQIDGYDSSNDVAANNLKAHWTFDDTNVERLSNLNSSNTYGTVGFEAGVIGSALKLTEGALKYPNLPALNTANALENYTASMWVKVKNNGGTAKSGYTALFGLFPDGLTANTVGDFMWGNINMAAETGWFPATNPQPDTLVLKGQFVIKNVDGGINGQDNRPDPRGTPPVGLFKQTGQWVHFVTRWNATTRQFHVFGNGVSIGAYTQRGTGDPMPLRMNVPCSPLFGNGATKEVGFPNNPDQQAWSPKATASIDDVRVFNTTLTDAEITALYNLGVAGR
jgi:hypothetical protein